jgi:hypothetical protein
VKTVLKINAKIRLTGYLAVIQLKGSGKQAGLQLVQPVNLNQLEGKTK